MKRSEMIDVIDEVLFANDLPLLQRISEQILFAIENAGMLPPETTAAEPGLIRNEWTDESWKATK